MNDIFFDDIPEYLLLNGFKEIKTRYPNESVKKAFRYGYKYEILIDPPYLRLMAGSQRKGEWVKSIKIHEFIGILVYLKLSEKQKEKVNVVNVSNMYSEAIIRNSFEKNFIDSLFPFEKKIINLYESFELKYPAIL